MIAFFGNSHAAQHLRQAARDKGFTIAPASDAELIFVSEDTPTDERGARDLAPIRLLLERARAHVKPTVLTSAVPPGFTRSLDWPDLWHQAETLRIRDASERARNPEMLIVGSRDLSRSPPHIYLDYLSVFRCPIIRMTWEEAEFAKIAINAFLIGQVEITNALARAAQIAGANWGIIADVLRHDSRIGPNAYLTPGSWEASRHLLRDHVTLNELWSKGESDDNKLRRRVPERDEHRGEPAVARGDGISRAGAG